MWSLTALLIAAGLGMAQAGEATVTIDNFTFRPAEIVVVPGTRVTWINQDDIPHVVLGKNGAGLLKSPPMDTDDRFSAVFETPGEFAYSARYTRTCRGGSSCGDASGMKHSATTAWGRISMPGRSEFEALVLPHLPAAYNLARWLLGDAAAAEDAVQDAVVRALGAFEAYRGGAPRAWVLRIVRNTAFDALAARKRRGEAVLDETTADPADDPEAAFARAQGRDMLGAKLAALAPELRECLVLRELEGLSYREMSSVTEVPIGTVMSRLWRARRALGVGPA